jgi:hypothetical protein
MAIFKKPRARRRVSKALKKYVRSKNPRVKLPTTFIPAHVRVDQHGNVQIKVNPGRLKGTGKFARCVKSVEAKGGAYDPRSVCGAMEKRYRRNSGGRKQYPYAVMQKLGTGPWREIDSYVPGTSPMSVLRQLKKAGVVRKDAKYKVVRMYLA